ncbi:MAG: hypothetical protein GY950_27720, partial [bacterium]|nr:hypothetical protein [bacterium]
MKESNKIFVLESDKMSLLKQVAGDGIETMPIEELHTKDEKFINAVVFLDNKSAYIQKIKEILLQNPGINFILYYKEPLPPSKLVEFVQSGVTEYVCLDDEKQLKELIKRFKTHSDEVQLNYYHNLISRFRDI